MYVRRIWHLTYVIWLGVACKEKQMNYCVLRIYSNSLCVLYIVADFWHMVNEVRVRKLHLLPNKMQMPAPRKRSTAICNFK